MGISADPRQYSTCANKARRGRLVEALSEGLRWPRDLKPLAPNAVNLLLDSVYGWFERIERGVYGLTEANHAVFERWPQAA